LDHGISFRPCLLWLTAFIDSDWAGDLMDRRSTIGLIVFLGNNPITWQSKKQPTVARSSTEAEYRAMANYTADLTWYVWFSKILVFSFSLLPLSGVTILVLLHWPPILCFMPERNTLKLITISFEKRSLIETFNFVISALMISLQTFL
jgi:hypothetical protein